MGESKIHHLFHKRHVQHCIGCMKNKNDGFINTRINFASFKGSEKFPTFNSVTLPLTFHPSLPDNHDKHIM